MNQLTISKKELRIGVKKRFVSSYQKKPYVHGVKLSISCYECSD
jgi:hypothetical protein